MRRYLQVRWSKNKGFYVENLFVVECESDDDLMAVLEEGRLCMIQSIYQGSHRLEKYLNLEGFFEKSMKIKSALKKLENHSKAL